MNSSFRYSRFLCVGLCAIGGCASAPAIQSSARKTSVPAPVEARTAPVDSRTAAIVEARTAPAEAADVKTIAVVAAIDPPGEIEAPEGVATKGIEARPVNARFNSSDQSDQSDQSKQSEQSEQPAVPIDPSDVPINLPTALAMIGGQHPVVGFARWRVQEAYAQVDRAQAMWLPSIQTGFNYRRRDGNYQAVDGAIVDVNLNSMNYGLGSGAVAAGSPTRPGIVAEFHLADALFLPKVAEKTSWARGHAASATLNTQLLNGAIAYIDLLEAYQDGQIVHEAEMRTADLAKLTEDFAVAGQGLQSDADRTATELSLLRTRRLAVRERQLVASTRLARALSIPMTSRLLPQDTITIPLDFVPPSTEESSLISVGLTTRPELKESQALVAAACEAYKREKYAPFVPSVLLGFSTTRFGGGVGRESDHFGGRYDIDAMMVWETRNLGLGEAAARRERNSQIQQATLAKLAIMDQVAQEVAEAHVQTGSRKQQVETAESAIARARDSYERNVDRIREGQGLPIEVLQSIQALEESQRAYLRAVADYNRSQLQLQWALGWPVDRLANAD